MPVPDVAEDPVLGLDACRIAGAIRRGHLTSMAVVEACLERIRRRDGTVAAWQHVDEDLALEQARARDREHPRGPLHGVPVGIKDNIDTADQPTTYGSPLFAGHRPSADAEVVRRLRDAGAVVLGKTVTPEFAASGVLGRDVPATHGFSPRNTRHPLDPSRTPGKSSAGSAAATADHMIPLALGTQTAGSLVAPASFCGLFGFRPTLDTVPMDGVAVMSRTLDTVGVLSRSAADLAVTARVLAGRPMQDKPLRAVSSPPRVGIARTEDWERVHPASRAVLDELEAHLRRMTTVTRITLPPLIAALGEVQATVMRYEVAETLAAHRDADPGLMSRQLRERIDPELQPERGEYTAALRQTAEARDAIPALFSEVDVVVTPATQGEAPQEVGFEASFFCRTWSLLGLPVVALPVTLGPSGLPVGVQVLAPPAADEGLIAATDWIDRHRPAFGAVRGVRKR